MLLLDYVFQTVLSDPIALWLLFILGLFVIGWILAKLLPVREAKSKKFDGGKAIATKQYKKQYVSRGK